mgnify:CR=1 FL=1
MDTRVEKTIERHKKGYNCAQAVACTYCDLVGVDEEKVQTVIDIIREHSHSRKQMIPTTTEMSYGYYPSMPVEVVVGGATIFVVDIERFERV